MPLLSSLTWMQIYRRKALLAHRPMIIIFPGTLWPDRVPWRTLTVWSGFPPSLFENASLYLPKESVPDFSEFVVIFEVIAVF